MTDKSRIEQLISPHNGKIKISVVKETVSTNTDLKLLACQGEEEISVLIADRQSGGKGRKGRSFFSPAESGCYMSFLVRPDCTAEQSTLLTTMAATVTAEAIERVTGKKARIKWVNDIFLEGKKVGGILTEARISPVGNGLDWAVVGIGINLREPDGGFPEELSEIAGSICTNADEDMKNRLIAQIISGFLEEYPLLHQKNYIKRYRNRLFFLGEKITVVELTSSYTATAVDVDEMCRLIVELPDKSRKALCSGEISVLLGKR